MAFFNIPGVYSKIDASAAVQSISANDTVIGVVATADTGEDNVAYAPISFDDAKQVYGADSEVVKLIKHAMSNGGNKFIVVKAEDDVDGPDYKTALEVLEMEEAVTAVITDSTDPIVHSLIKDHCKSASENRRERIAFIGYSDSTSISTVKSNASTVNDQHIYVAYPNPLDSTGVEVSGIYLAAAYAGAVAAETDPSKPMTDVELFGFFGLATKLKDSEISSLIDSGITPLEVRNGAITIVRAVSTYTKNAESEIDITWQELTTVRISHYVMKDLRKDLRSKFARSKQNEKTRDSIKTAVLNRLKTYEGLEYIENVNDTDVSIIINPTNPTRNDVDFKYDVVTPLNVIHITGHLVL